MSDGRLPGALRATLEEALGSRLVERGVLTGGCVATVLRARLEDGRDLVLKIDPDAQRGAGTGAPAAHEADSALEAEGWMLGQLREAGWPVPDVYLASPACLAMAYVPNDGRMGDAGEAQAGRLLAALHAAPQPAFGLSRDTLIAGLLQPNPRSARWLPFFAEHRLIFMARRAEAAGALGAGERRRVERLASRLDHWLQEPDHPSLLHGDLWGGNILFRRGRVAALIDPAIYRGDAEAELAFTTLFGTFGEAFFRAYGAHRPLRDGFFEERRDLYNIYPLLVHVHLFGAPYLAGLRSLLRRYGV